MGSKEPMSAPADAWQYVSFASACLILTKCEQAIFKVKPAPVNRPLSFLLPKRGSHVSRGQGRCRKPCRSVPLQPSQPKPADQVPKHRHLCLCLIYSETLLRLCTQTGMAPCGMSWDIVHSELCLPCLRMYIAFFHASAAFRPEIYKPQPEHSSALRRHVIAHCVRSFKALMVWAFALPPKRPQQSASLIVNICT